MRSTFRLMFYINRNKVKSDGTTAILCRISIDGRKSAVTTGIYCKPSDWDSNKGEIRMNKENNRLTAFRSRLEEAYGNLLKNQGVVTGGITQKLPYQIPFPFRNSCCRPERQNGNGLESVQSRLTPPQLIASQRQPSSI